MSIKKFGGLLKVTSYDGYFINMNSVPCIKFGKGIFGGNYVKLYTSFQNGYDWKFDEKTQEYVDIKEFVNEFHNFENTETINLKDTKTKTKNVETNKNTSSFNGRLPTFSSKKKQ